jgi:hypothetical protein
VPPGTARAVLAVEHHVVDAAPPQVVGGGKAGLARADDDHRHGTSRAAVCAQPETRSVLDGCCHVS